MATATTGDEYKLLHQTSFLIKAARIFSLIWILAVIVPALYGIAKYGENIKEFAVVKTVGAANNVLADQYDAFTDKVLKSVDVDKYTAKLKIPEVKLDTSKLEKLTKTTDKAKKLSLTLSKFGVKEADNGSEQQRARRFEKRSDGFGVVANAKTAGVKRLRLQKSGQRRLRLDVRTGQKSDGKRLQGTEKRRHFQRRRA